MSEKSTYLDQFENLSPKDLNKVFEFYLKQFPPPFKVGFSELGIEKVAKLLEDQDPKDLKDEPVVASNEIFQSDDLFAPMDQIEKDFAIGIMTYSLTGDMERRADKNNEHRNLLFGKMKDFLSRFAFVPKSFVPLVCEELRDIYESGSDGSIHQDGKEFLPILMDNYEGGGLFDPERATAVILKSYLYLSKEYEETEKMFSELREKCGWTDEQLSFANEVIGDYSTKHYGERPDKGKLLDDFEDEYFGSVIPC